MAPINLILSDHINVKYSSPTVQKYSHFKRRSQQVLLRFWWLCHPLISQSVSSISVKDTLQLQSVHKYYKKLTPNSVKSNKTRIYIGDDFKRWRRIHLKFGQLNTGMDHHATVLAKTTYGPFEETRSCRNTGNSSSQQVIHTGVETCNFPICRSL